LERTCPYPGIFEPGPPADSEVLRTHSDVPLPFVIEPPEDQRTTYERGETLGFRIVLIGRATVALPYFIVTFQRLGEAGLGRDRARFTLHEVAALRPTDDARSVLLTDGALRRDMREHTMSAAELAAPDAGAHPEAVTLHFLTPTRLKHADRFVEGPPAFHVVIRALLRRVSSLSYFYGGQRWEVDYRGWIERAEQVQIADAEVRWVDWERFSTRQGREMNLGGIVGRVTYAGDRGQEAGDRGQGTGVRGQGTGSRDQVSGSREQGAEGQRNEGAGEQAASLPALSAGSGPAYQCTNLPASQSTNLPISQLGAFLPLLRLGELVHVGKAAVFGNGRYEVSW
jgi:hypothetical protein